MLDRGLPVDSCCAARAIGYRQALDLLQRCHADTSAITAHGLVRWPHEGSSFPCCEFHVPFFYSLRKSNL